MLQRKPKRDGYLPLAEGPQNQSLPVTSAPTPTQDSKQGKLRRASPTTSASTERRAKSTGTSARNMIASGQVCYTPMNALIATIMLGTAHLLLRPSQSWHR
jgi:hypothetical protein